MNERPLRLAASGSLLVGAIALPTAASLSAIATTTSMADAVPLPTHYDVVVDSVSDNDPIWWQACSPDTPAPGMCTLRNAMVFAEFAHTYGDGASTSITFAPNVTGTITLTSSLPLIYGDTRITGPGADVLTIEGSGTFAGFVQKPVPTQTRGQFAPIDLEITGLALDGLSSFMTDPNELSVGTSTIGMSTTAINLFGGNLTVRDCTVSGSGANALGIGYLGLAPITAGFLAYGIYGYGRVGNVVIDGVEVAHNSGSTTANYQSAGSVLTFADSVSITNSSFHHNSATLGGGPLVFGTDVTIADVSITDNTAVTTAAGLGALGQNIEIARTLISGNTSRTDSGLISYGSLFDRNASSRVHVVDTAIIGNSVLYGPVSQIGAGEALLERVSIIGNDHGEDPRPQGATPTSNSYQLAALAIGSNTTIDSSTIAANVGAGIAVGDLENRNGGSSSISSLAPNVNTTTTTPLPDVPATLTVSHSTITNNTGGGIVMREHAVAERSASDTFLDHALVSDEVSVPSFARFSLLSKPTVAPLPVPGGAPEAGNLLAVDPEFPGTLPFECVGPLVCVVPIAYGTPAWDAGDPGFAPPPATDQRGEPRVIDIVDIGAYEVQVLTPRFTG